MRICKPLIRRRQVDAAEPGSLWARGQWRPRRPKLVVPARNGHAEEAKQEQERGALCDVRTGEGVHGGETRRGVEEGEEEGRACLCSGLEEGVGSETE